MMSRLCPWHTTCSEEFIGSPENVKAVQLQKKDALVLVVDDEEHFRNMILSSLQRERIPCMAASSVEEGMVALKNNPVSLLLLDWGLRGHLDTSGVQVLDFCKENYPTVPAIVMSGQEFDVRTDALTKHADGFLQKPLSGTVITSVVRQWLHRLDKVPRVFLPQTVDEIIALDEFKTLYIRHVLELVDYNISRAAEKLGVHRQTVAAALRDRDKAAS
jgi:DNA-binding NtrC family response regulator